MQVRDQNVLDDLVELALFVHRALHAGGDRTDDAVGQGKLGLALRPLQPQEKRESSLDNGLVVEDAQGPSALAGIQAGDVLLAINGTPARSVDQVRQAVAKADKSVALLIQRGDDRIFVPVRIG